MMFECCLYLCVLNKPRTRFVAFRSIYYKYVLKLPPTHTHTKYRAVCNTKTDKPKKNTLPTIPVLFASQRTNNVHAGTKKNARFVGGVTWFKCFGTLVLHASPVASQPPLPLRFHFHLWREHHAIIYPATYVKCGAINGAHALKPRSTLVKVLKRFTKRSLRAKYNEPPHPTNTPKK